MHKRGGIGRINGEPLGESVGGFPAAHVFFDDLPGLFHGCDAPVDVIAIGQGQTLVFQVVHTGMIEMKLMDKEITVPQPANHVLLQGF